MKKALRLICVLLTAAIMFSLCACSEKEDESTSDGQDNTDNKPVLTYSITLPVAHNDTIDPFKDISSVNRSLVTLLYDGLVLIDEGFTAQPLLISSHTNDGRVLTVTLRNDITFSDGSAINASDVVYSFDQSKKSSYYAPRLTNIKSASAHGNSVSFELISEDINALACLDFPVVKSGTVQTQYDDTNLFDITPPTGAGRYIINGKLPAAKLTPNPHCNRSESLSIGTISLFEVNDSDGMSYGLQIDNYDYWYNDLSTGQYTRVNAGLNVVPSNNLIYLAFNEEKSIFTEDVVRRAVSMLIDRNAIASQGFQGHATSASVPFNPAWSAMKKVTVSTQMSADIDGAKAILEKAGYTSINHYGYRCSNSKSLNCNLTVCRDNEFKVAAAKQIKEQLAKLNFNVRIIELPYKEYAQAIAQGDYEMYLGEVKIPANMNITDFFTSYGTPNCDLVLTKETEESTTTYTVCHNEYKDFLAGKLSIADFCKAFETEVPFVPVCYRSGIEIYSREFTSEIRGTCYDNFYNIDTWSIKTKTEEEK
ncbi:MAG: hypothetical protein IIW48_04760 [Clostridia bacterium]|nr:hypothetical protein [Clostridia bacterium]